MPIMKFRKLLLPFSPVYGAVVGLRNRMYDSGKLPSKSFDKPVIVVGNLTTGGTGKTPHTEMLVDLLNAERIKSAVLSRGYRRQTSDLIEVSTLHSAAEVGDEPKQIKLKHPNNLVVVNKDRVKGIEHIFSQHPQTKVIIMDDGFQHRAVKPGLSVLLIDHKDLDRKDFLLPAGNLRESKKGIERADIIIVTKTPEFFSPMEKRHCREKIDPDKSKKVFFTYMKYGGLYSIVDDGKPCLFDKAYYSERNYSVLLVSGIANADPLLDHIRQGFKQVEHISFKDHHSYSPGDVKRIVETYHKMPGENKIVLTTEKDAMRLMYPTLREIYKDIPLFFISIEAWFHHDEYKTFKSGILDYVSANTPGIQFSAAAV
jgi:tetraacyldisaccharide 4'-kinase